VGGTEPAGGGFERWSDTHDLDPLASTTRLPVDADDRGQRDVVDGVERAQIEAHHIAFA
jgi:hypothetical protein